MKKVVILSVIIGCCLLAIEVAAQAWEYNLAQSSAGWELVATRRLRFDYSSDGKLTLMTPDQNYFWEGVNIHINSQNLRHDSEYSFEKGPDSYRILILGDSVTFGWELPLKDTFPELLEKALNEQDSSFEYEVINASTPGWDTARQLVYLERYGLQYHPDLIILEFTVLNDVEDCFESSAPISALTPSVGQWLRDNTATWGFVSNLAGSLKQHPIPTENQTSTLPGYPFPTSEDDPVWNECIANSLLALAKLSEQNNAHFVILVFPSDLQVRYSDYPTTPQTVLRRIGAESNIPMLDLLTPYREQYNRDPGKVEEDSDNPLFADFYSHPSLLGNRIAVQTVVQSLEEIGFISGFSSEPNLLTNQS